MADPADAEPKPAYFPGRAITLGTILLGSLPGVLMGLSLLPGPPALERLSPVLTGIAAILVVLCTLPALVIFIACGGVAVFSPVRRPSAIRWALLCIALVLTAVVSLRVTRRLRMRAMNSVAERAEPLLRAIEQYRTEFGECPPDLPALSPTWIREIPTTGMAAYPHYKYKRPDANSKMPATYEVYVPCSLGFLNWDILFYWPEGNYPREIYGGYVAPVGRWAYVNE